MKSLRRLGFRKKGEKRESETPVQESKPKEESAPAPPPAETIEPVATQSATTEMATCKIYVVFYTMYGHVHKMAQAVKKGIDSVDGCEAVLYQVAETLPEEVLQKMHAAPKPDVPILNPTDLAEAHAVVFGFPTRFGMMCAQMKAFFDATGGLWQSGALVGKPASIFVSTGTQGGGQETTVMTALTQLVHHGMIFIPPGYTKGAALFNVDEVRGGGPWGAGTFAAADGSRQPSQTELDAAEHQGSYFATKAKLLCA